MRNLLSAIFLPVAFLPISTDTLFAQRDFSQVEIEVTPVRGGVFMISGGGGNMAAFVGEDGVFLVDANYAELSEQVLTAIGDLCERESVSPTIRFIINTHWHSDHTGGNANIAAEGAIIVGHENVLRLLSHEQVMTTVGDRVPAAPEASHPNLTFNDRMNLSWNGDLIHIVHVADAHTDGDAIVHFRDADIVHMGDIVFNGRYPFIDVDNGGNIDGMANFVTEALAHTNETTMFIPGHGGLASRQDLIEYRDMLLTVRDRIQGMIDRGMTQDEIIDAKPTADLDASWSSTGTSANPDFWVRLVYVGMVGIDGAR